MYRQAIIAGKNWDAIAETQKCTSLGEGCSKVTQKRIAEMLKCIDFMCDMQTPNDESKESKTYSLFSKVKIEARVHVKKTPV